MNIVDIRPWSSGNRPLLERLVGDPAMTEPIGGPETPEEILKRPERYGRSSGDAAKDTMFVIVVGPEETPAGSIG